MPIPFVPRPNTVLMCDYGPDPRTLVDGVRNGPLAVPPELWKVRQVVVMSHGQGGSCLVVPFSTEAPRQRRGYHHRVPAGTYPFFDRASDSWAKADLMGVVSLARLDRVRVDGRYRDASLSDDDFRDIRVCVLDALGLRHLLPGPRP